MPRQPHEKTEFEFAAKRVNDLLREIFPDTSVQFMTFLMDEGDSGYVGYISSTRRIDAVRVIMEWLSKMIESFDRQQLREMLVELEKELAAEELNPIK